MRSYEGYLYELNTIDTELKRINEHAKNLRLQRTRVLGALYRYMCSNNLDKVSYGKKDITLKQCTPREKRGPTISKKEKKKNALELYREVGIPDPERFYKDFENTQKAQRMTNTNESSSTNNNNGMDDIFGPSNARNKEKKGKSTKSAYDASLGF
jgi:hypothetical protein